MITEFRISNIVGNLEYQGSEKSIQELADSIADIGQLQNIVLNSRHEIIAGRRRVAAFKKLGKPFIMAMISDQYNDVLKALKAERDENTCRLERTPLQKKELADRIVALLSPIAKENSNSNLMVRIPGAETDDRVVNLSTHENCGKTHDSNETVGRVKDQAAEAAGISRSTLEKIDAIVDEAKADPETMTPVVEEMEKTGKVDPAFKKAKENKKSRKKDPLLDANGKEVPELLRDIFGDVWLNKSLGDLDSMLTTLANVQSRLKGKGQFYKWMQLTNALNGIEDAIKAVRIAHDSIEHGKPHVVCPRCEGTKKVKGESCGACRGSGYLSVWREQDLREQGNA